MRRLGKERQSANSHGGLESRPAAWTYCSIAIRTQILLRRTGPELALRVRRLELAGQGRKLRGKQ